MARTLFTVDTEDYIILHSHNHAYRSSKHQDYDQDVFVPDSPIQFSEGGTPAPEAVPPARTLRFTTDHMPRCPSQGFVFGANRDKCDILLHVDRTTGVSGRQFAVTFNTETGVIILKNLSRNGTRIIIGEDPIHLKTQRAISETNEVKIKIAHLEMSLSKTESESTGSRYLDFLRKLGSALPDVGQVRLGSTISSEISTSSTSYLLGPVIGKGASAIVHRAVHKISGGVVAVKCFADNAKVGNPWTESSILCSLRHNNIIRFHEFNFCNGREPWLIMEFAVLGSLLSQSQLCRFNDQDGRSVVRQTLDGLAYLHDKGVIHRDLKPGNILVITRQPVHIKVADFGISTNTADDHNTMCGTNIYAAPEVWKPPYAEKIDLWSVGIIILELWAGLPSYARNTWFHEVLVRKTTASRGVIDFLDHFLQLDPKERSPARQCLSLPFLTKRHRPSQVGQSELHPILSERQRTVVTASKADDGITDNAIWIPVIPKELSKQPPNQASETAILTCDQHVDRIPTWNPINPESWIPGGEQDTGLNNFKVEPKQPAPHRKIRMPPSLPMPEKPQCKGQHDFVAWGNAWIAYNPGNGTINVTHILRAVQLKRSNLHAPNIKTMMARKVSIRGNPKIQGTFLPYEDAIIVCDHFSINTAFLRELGQ